MKAIQTIKHTGQASMEKICNCFNVHRDAYYKSKKRDQYRKTIESQVINLVEQERKQQPRVGTRKLHEALHDEFKKARLKVGRDFIQHA
jgi:putative transposase